MLSYLVMEIKRDTNCNLHLKVPAPLMEEVNHLCKTLQICKIVLLQKTQMNTLQVLSSGKVLKKLATKSTY